MTDISAPTVECSICYNYIDIRTLNNHNCVKNHPTTPLFGVFDSQKNAPLPSPHMQTQSRERSNAVTNSIRRTLQKNQPKITESPVSPTLSSFSITSSNNTILTPRSSDEFFQHYLLKHEMDLLTVQRNNSLVRSTSTKRKKPATEPAALEQLVRKMSIKDDLCQHCSKYMALCDVIKDPITKFSYHRSCYCCSLCQTSLSLSNACEYLGKLYCGRDYQVMKARANKSTAFPAQSQSSPLPKTKMFMPRSCYHCKIEFDDTDTSYKLFKNRIYCNRDFRRLFLPKCQSCHKTVEKEVVSSTDGKLKGKWHPECFNCQMCHVPFPDKTFYIFENQPYCKTHYHCKSNSLCNRCHKGIENQCAQTAEGWLFHPKCFTCEVCHDSLKDSYYVFKNKIYCENHIDRQYETNDNYEHLRPSSLLDKRRTPTYSYF